MLVLDFEWDEEKARSNLAKHGISFDEAVAVFADDDLLVIDASRPADGEARFKAIGRIEGRLLVVIFTKRGDAVRVISARRANDQEDRAYDHRQNEA